MQKVSAMLEELLGSSVELLEYLPALRAAKIMKQSKEKQLALRQHVCVKFKHNTYGPNEFIFLLTECCEWQGIAASWKNKLKAVYKGKEIVKKLAGVVSDESKRITTKHHGRTKTNIFAHLELPISRL